MYPLRVFYTGHDQVFNAIQASCILPATGLTKAVKTGNVSPDQGPLTPPISCFIDGLQLGSGCTVGKRNLKIAEGARIACVFGSKAGSAVSVAMRPEIPDKVRAWIERMGVTKAGETVFDLPSDELFTVKKQ